MTLKQIRLLFCICDVNFKSHFRPVQTEIPTMFQPVTQPLFWIEGQKAGHYRFWPAKWASPHNDRGTLMTSH